MTNKNNYLSIRILLGGTLTDISAGVDINSIRLQDRADLAFVRGSFKLVSSIINKNIPPYTLCKIATMFYDEEQEEYEERNVENFFITSKMVKNFTKGLYIHDVTLLSAESILECFNLGTKSYTYETYYQVLDETINFIAQKYGNLGITFVDNNLLNGASDFTFGTGTTLYEVCKQVAEKLDIKFKVMFNAQYDIVIWFYAYNSEFHKISIDNSSTFLLNCEDSQDSDNYCKYLETESSNVVDRDELTVWRDLSCRTTDVRLVQDNALIMLPTNVEGIVKFELKASFNFLSGIDTTAIDGNWIMANGGTDTYTSYQVTKTYQQLINANISYGSITNIFKYFYDNLLYRVDGILTKNCLIATTDYSLDSGVNIQINEGNSFTAAGVIDYSDKILEKAEFNNLTDLDKTNYVFYETGSNVIQNLNNRYRDDFWGVITNNASGNFFSHLAKTETCKIDSNNECRLVIATTSTYPTDYLYNVYAVAITNPTLIDTKDSVEENESAYKPVSRSYQMGDSNGMPVYFDALVADMDKQNETLGRIEKVVDIDTTNFVIPDNTTAYPDGTLFMPFANQKVVYFGTTFFVASLEHKFTASKRYTQLNLTKTPYKVADAIGVDYQFNSVKIPLQNIITRGLFLEVANTPLYNLINQYAGSVFVRFTNSSCDLVKRASISKDRQDNYYLYFETIDNYSFDKAIDTSDLNNIVCYDVPYSDSEGKFTTLTLKAYVVTGLTIAQSKALPYYSALPNNLSSYDLATNWYVYKDTREKLTFTIKIRKPE